MKKLSRRDFFRFAAVYAGSVVLSSCSKKNESFTTTKSERLIAKLNPGESAVVKNISRDKIMSQLDRKVNLYMDISNNCAQTSFLALKEQFDLDNGSILKALTPLPGIAERGETCGAVVGSLMALGLVYGRDRLYDRVGYHASLQPARTFCDLFEHDLGSTMCGDILESQFGKRFNLADSTDLAEFRASGATTICSGVVRKAVRIAAELILDKL